MLNSLIARQSVIDSLTCIEMRNDGKTIATTYDICDVMLLHDDAKGHFYGGGLYVHFRSNCISVVSYLKYVK